jgi:hypothetical protein
MIESKAVLAYIDNISPCPKSKTDKTSRKPFTKEIRASNDYVYQWTGKTWRRSKRTKADKTYPLSYGPVLVDHISVDNDLILSRRSLNGIHEIVTRLGTWRKK